MKRDELKKALLEITAKALCMSDEMPNSTEEKQKVNDAFNLLSEFIYSNAKEVQ